jgi:tRNA A37 N6-isopentenylltransferase MiaA
MLGRPSVVFVLGATGSGKSRLAIDLALALESRGGAEVINCDAIQMYRGLDVASAKTPRADRRGVPHHLLSFLAPRASFTVRDFRALAGAAIRDVVARGRTPVVTGGTLYYAQALLREGGMLDEAAEVALARAAGGGPGLAGGAALVAGGATATVSGDAARETLAGSGGAEVSGAAAATSGADADAAAAAVEESPYERLCRVDPVMARRLHPHDRRKIARALQVFETTGGVAYSRVLELQAQRLRGAGAAGSGSVPSPYASKVFWLHVADRGVLNAQLDRRSRSMLENGLVAEQRALRGYLNATPAPCSVSALGGDEPSELTVRLVRELNVATGDADLTRGGSTPLCPESVIAACSEPPMPPPNSLPARMPSMPPPASFDLLSAPLSTPIEGRSEGAGLLQAIGYKEFDEYLTLLDILSGAGGVEGCNPDAKRARTDNTCGGSGGGGGGGVGGGSCGSGSGSGGSSLSSSSVALAAALARAERRLNEVTHQYARKQERWMRNRFASRGVRMTVIDSSCVGDQGSSSTDAWGERVARPAINNLLAWLAVRGPDGAGGGDSAGEDEDVPPAPEADRVASWRQHVCKACDGRRLNGDLEWEQHLVSKAHLRRTRRTQVSGEGEV